jgi:hypothetical protein
VASGEKVNVFDAPAARLLVLVGVPVTVKVTVLLALLRLSVPVAALVFPDAT